MTELGARVWRKVVVRGDDGAVYVEIPAASAGMTELRARAWRSEWGHGVAEWGGVGFGPQIKSGATDSWGGGRRLLVADSRSGAGMTGKGGGMTGKGDGCGGVGSGYGG